MSNNEKTEKTEFLVVSFSELGKVYDEKVYDTERILADDGISLYFPVRFKDGKIDDYVQDYNLDREYKYYTVDKRSPGVPEVFSEFLEKPERKGIDKWASYFEVYDTYFGKYRNKPVKMLEIGIFHGGSLQMWKDYFGKDASIVGIDINPDCKKYEEPQIDIRIGSQSDREFLKKVADEFGPFDIILDDGGHMMDQQIISFEELFPAVKSGGVYMCEDCHTSYWNEFGGGLKRPGTFIETTKTLLDHIHGWRIKGGRSEYTKSIKAMHYYDSIVVFEKDVVNPPVRIYLEATGKYKTD